MLTSSAIKARAHDLGFDLCGVAPAADFDELRFLDTWIARRYYGTMTWLPRTARVRRDVRRILPSAQSVIVTGTLYNTDRPYSTEDSEAAQVSRYAWGHDYHAVVGERLEALLAWMREADGAAFEARAYTDTGPDTGACLRATRGSWLDRQAHVPHQRGSGVVALPRRNHLQPAARARRASRRPLRQLPALSAVVSHRRHRRTVGARRAPVYLVSHHRETGHDARWRTPRADWHAGVRL